MIGIVLAGGTGSRLWPITFAVSKQLLPVYDKPLIHYPISTLMSAGIREIIIITTPEDQSQFQKLLGSGEKLGVNFYFLTQAFPEGLAQAFTIAERLISGHKVCLILGDNIFFGTGLGSQLRQHSNVVGAKIFAYKVSDPERYGVVDFDENRKAISITEKPSSPKSPFAIPGLYFYDERVVDIAKKIKKSERGEFEISSVNQSYLNIDQLNVEILPRGTAWLDTGTFSSLSDASMFVRTIEERQGTKIACLEEIAYRNGWIDKADLLNLARNYKSGTYGDYLEAVARENF